MRAVIAVFLFAGALFGCATPAQRAIQKTSEVEQMMQIYGPACERLGYIANSDLWRNCVVQLNQTDVQRYSYPAPYYSRLGPYW